jgi:hypothetical protein
MPITKTVYLPHPVSPETKAKHIAAGERIIDIRFAPAGYAAPSEKAPVVSNKVEPVAEPEPIAEVEAVVEPTAPKRRGRRKANW